MFEDLKIIHYPDPRLKKTSKAVHMFDDGLAALAARMFVLMRQAKGVGLAAPQVGKNIRLFVMNPTGDPEDDRVYVNPVLDEIEGEESAEEGCLSIPEVHVDVVRGKRARLHAQDLTGAPVELVETGYVARVWQHETDHLNGTLLTDRMGPVAKMAHRKRLKELEEEYLLLHPPKPPLKTPPGVDPKPKRKRK